MNGTFARSAMGAPALRAALVSMVMMTSALSWRMPVLNALTAPAGPLSSSRGTTLTGWPRMPPFAFSSSAASWADCTTAGATTLFTPLSPSGMAITTGFFCCDRTGATARIDIANIKRSSWIP